MIRRRGLSLAGGLVLALWCGALAYAQTQHYIQWDPNPANDNVTYYTLTFDTTVFSVPPTVDATCNCVQQAVSVSSGSHQACVTASNTFGTSTATCISFNANAAGKVTNVRIK